MDGTQSCLHDAQSRCPTRPPTAASGGRLLSMAPRRDAGGGVWRCWPCRPYVPGYAGVIRCALIAHFGHLPRLRSDCLIPLLSRRGHGDDARKHGLSDVCSAHELVTTVVGRGRGGGEPILAAQAQQGGRPESLLRRHVERLLPCTKDHIVRSRKDVDAEGRRLASSPHRLRGHASRPRQPPVAAVRVGTRPRPCVRRWAGRQHAADLPPRAPHRGRRRSGVPRAERLRPRRLRAPGDKRMAGPAW